MLLEEFEHEPAIIEPSDRQISSQVVEVCSTIICAFSGELVERVSRFPQTRFGGATSSINGDLPWYIVEENDLKVAVTMLPVGAAMTVGKLEELKAIGFENFIILGSCGVLDKNLEADRIILPTSALRDEGTSYHYAPASPEIAYPLQLIETMETSFSASGIAHTRAKTWTTDAFYRETPAKVERRLAAGARVVDMEASAIMAWSQFRQARVYQFFYTADYLDHKAGRWDKRAEKRQADVLTFWKVALTLAKKLENE